MTQSTPARKAPQSIPPSKQRNNPISFPQQSLDVEVWIDPVIDQLGHDPHSAYVEQYWLPIVGPSSILLIRKLATNLNANPTGFSFSAAQWAVELGVGSRGGTNGTFWRSIERICRFGAARRQGQLLLVRRKLSPLTSRQVSRLPPELRRSHNAWAAEQLNSHRHKTSDQHAPCQPSDYPVALKAS